MAVRSKVAGQNESVDLIPVQLDSLDRDKALGETKRLIDAGGMTNDVRFTPKADMCSAPAYVHFPPDFDGTADIALKGHGPPVSNRGV